MKYLVITLLLYSGAIYADDGQDTYKLNPDNLAVREESRLRAYRSNGILNSFATNDSGHRQSGGSQGSLVSGGYKASVSTICGGGTSLFTQGDGTHRIRGCTSQSHVPSWDKRSPEYILIDEKGIKMLVADSVNKALDENNKAWIDRFKKAIKELEDRLSAKK